MVTADRTFRIDTYTKKKKESKHNTKDNHATTREQKTKRRGKRPIKTIPKQLAK